MADNLKDSTKPNGKQTEKVPSFDSLASDLVGAMPEVKSHVIESRQEKIQEVIEEARLSGFDPEIHAVNLDGTPKINKKSNSFTKKRVKRRVSDQDAAASGLKTPSKNNELHSESGQVPPMPEGPSKDAQATGAAAAGLFFTMGMLLGGDEWAPQKANGIDEAEVITDSFVKYCEAKNIRDIPPGVALVGALCLYSIPRLTKPRTSHKIKKFGKYIGDKIGKVFKKNKKVVPPVSKPSLS